MQATARTKLTVVLVLAWLTVGQEEGQSALPHHWVHSHQLLLQVVDTSSGHHLKCSKSCLSLFDPYSSTSVLSLILFHCKGRKYQEEEKSTNHCDRANSGTRIVASPSFRPSFLLNWPTPLPEQGHSRVCIWPIHSLVTYWGIYKWPATNLLVPLELISLLSRATSRSFRAGPDLLTCITTGSTWFTWSMFHDLFHPGLV